MGRIAGVTAGETRQRVLETAAAVFARKGYDAAGIAEIAAGAGVSSGAIYGHFASKGELFVATLRSHAAAEAERLLAVGGSGPEIVSLLFERGLALAERGPGEGALLVEAIVAAKRHPDVAALLRASIAEREERITGLFRAGQADGTIDATLPPDAVARFLLMLVLGSVLVSAMNLPPVSSERWATLIGSLVGRVSDGGEGGVPDRPHAAGARR